LTLLAYELEPNNPVQVSYFASNPSIVKTETGYLVNIRYVNYLVIDGTYPSTSPERQVKTKNILVELDRDFKELRRAVVDETSRSKYPCFITGIEDIRLKPGSTFEQAEFIGTVCDHWPLYNNYPRMLKGVMKHGRIIQSFLPAIPNLNRAEKNWIPIEDDNRYLYGFSKGKMEVREKEVKREEENKEGEEVKEKEITNMELVTPSPDHFTVELIQQEYNMNLSWIRGSSQLIKYKGGYIAIIHHVAMEQSGDKFVRRYLHRWVQWNDKLQITHMSHPFILADSLIQYIPGLCLDHELKHFIISLSIHDRTAQLRKISCSDIEEMLVPIQEIL
jgi:hypothetical protein